MSYYDPYDYRPGQGTAGNVYNYRGNKPPEPTNKQDTAEKAETPRKAFNYGGYKPPEPKKRETTEKPEKPAKTFNYGGYKPPEPKKRETTEKAEKPAKVYNYGGYKPPEPKKKPTEDYYGQDNEKRNDSGYDDANLEDKSNRDYQYYLDNYYNKGQNDDDLTLQVKKDLREKTPGDQKGLSVRKKYYENVDLDDVLQDKIATQLRENGIAETKVLPLSAKIAQAVRDDVVDSGQSASPQVTANLTEAIHKHLDPMLYNKANTTDLSNAQKPSDATHLSNLVLLRIGQVHEEIELCKLSVDDPLKRGKNKNTPREDPPDRSMLMTIKDGIEKQKTEKEILKDKLKQAQKETDFVEDDKEKREQQLQDLDAENWQLKRDLNEADQDKQSLIAKVREQQKDYDRLDRANTESRHENMMLKKKLEDSQNQNGIISRDLAKLQSENARLQVLADQKEKEILHLRDPDKDMVHNIRILSDEVTLLRTQTRRLNEEKGMLKSRTQKMESSLDESYKQRNKLSAEKDQLFRENQDLKQRYRKLALAAPKQRTLPDIMTGRNGPSSRATSRNDSRVVRRSDDKKMSPTREVDERDYH